ncbi:MAG: 4-(cytidine 5'-diphospho)-2-C-methyl-D-erythritol kinase [Ginsengibacter sp.]
MIAFPNCKINIGLNIVSKRKDSYHDLETVFYPLDFFDTLEIISTSGKNEFTFSGLPVINDQHNLCIKAYDLLKKDFPELPFIKLHLHKAIPAGAGLGGGSADGVFTLKMLNDKFLLGLSKAQLKDYALQLGSDCPFFLYNQPCSATKRGEQLEPINLNLSSYKILLVNPGIHIDTSWAFLQIKPGKQKNSIKETITQPVKTWNEQLINDFEIPVFESYPEIKKIKEILYGKGALYASLSGSGSTVYGIYKKAAPVNVEFPDDYFTRVINLK